MESTIKSFEDACKYLGESTALPEVAGLSQRFQRPNVINHQLMIITAALNKEANAGEEWVPDWNNDDQYKYYPWFRMYDKEGEPAGSGFSFGVYADDFSHSLVGSRLCFLSEELVQYAVATFLELYKEYFLILG